MTPDRLTDSLSIALPAFDLDQTRAELDRLTAERALLISQGSPAHFLGTVEASLTAALFAELQLDADGSRVPTDTLNEIAHSLTQGMDLLGAPLAAQLDNAELAASLFSAAEQTPKAVAVTNGYRGIIQAIERGAQPAKGSPSASLRPLLQAFLSALIRRDLKAVSRVAGHLENAARFEQLERDEARLALVLSAIAEQVDHLARDPARPEDVGALAAKVKVARRIAIESGNEDYLSSVQRMIASLRTFLRNATRLVAAREDVTFTPDYWSEIVGTGSRHPILELWPPQREALKDQLLDVASVVVSMPTSAGKTLLAEMKMAQVLASAPDTLAIYVAPYTSLAQQVREKLAERLQPAGLGEPRVWTGSYEIDTSLETLGRILVMTPEKLDSVLRAKLEDDPRTADLEARLKLVVLDECHLIGTEGRGLTYELLVSRLRKRLPRVQLCAMSAVLGNPEPLAEWIADDSERVVRSDWRPGRARVIVYNRDGSIVDESGSPVAELSTWRIAKKAAAAVTAALVEAGEWPVLVMDSQRRYAEEAATQLYQDGAAWDDGDEADEQRARAAGIARDLLGDATDLPSMLRAGIAFHHAGLPPVVRAEIESLTRNRHLRVVASTTTLAEGIDLPFRVVVCPHINYESGYMSRQLYQNIAGRAGRAFSGVEGWLVFLEPGSSKLSKYMWEVLLAEGDTPLHLTSWVSQLGRAIVKPEDWQRDWRYQSQLLGLLGDGHQSEDQVSTFIASTFAAAGGGKGLGPARRRGTQILEGMEEDPPLALAASPYALTPFGRTACLTGLSADSARILRRELIHAAEAADDWGDSKAWEGDASGEILERLVSLAFAPLEALAQAIRMPARYSLFANVVRAWRDGHQHALFNQVTETDRPILLKWMSGEDVRTLAGTPPDPLPDDGPLRRATDIDRLMDLNNYFSRIPAFLAWMYSGAVRVAEYLMEEEELTIPEEVRLGVDYLRLGVSSPAARFLADTVSIPRTAATLLASTLPFDPDDLEVSVLQALFEQGAHVVRDGDLDEWTRREAARSIRLLERSPTS